MVEILKDTVMKKQSLKNALEIKNEIDEKFDAHEKQLRSKNIKLMN